MTSGPRPAPVHARRLSRALLLPRVAWLGIRTPRDPEVGWNRFWAGISATGDGGDVLWDSSSEREAVAHLGRMRPQLDTSLPIVDVGCGNGRFTRALAADFPRVVGIDLSPDAIARARLESAAFGSVSYLAVDATAPGAGARLRAEVGEANAFVRGVFHVLDRAGRIALAATLHDLVGTRGRVVLAETNYRGGSLGYLQHLGATARRIPAPLENAMVSLPRPGHFGAPERAECFPASSWTVIDDGPTTIQTVPMRGPEEPELIPGYFAVLAPK